MVWIRASIRVAGGAVLALHVSVSSFHLKFFRAGSRKTSDSGADTDPGVDPDADPDADDAPDLTESDPGAGGALDSVDGDDASDSHAVLAVVAVAVCVGSDTDRQV